MTSTAPVRHKTAHHLSSRTDAHGWVESISNLTENTPATELMLRETDSVHQVPSFHSRFCTIGAPASAGVAGLLWLPRSQQVVPGA